MTDKKAGLPEDVIVSNDKFGKRDQDEVDITLSNHRPRMLIDNSVFSSSSTAYRGRHQGKEEKETSCCFPFLK